MADVTTKIAGQDVTLLDVDDPGYTPPVTGYAIHMNDTQSRNFIRLGELARLREERDKEVYLRDDDNSVITSLQDERLARIAIRDERNTRIGELNTRIQELVAWLTQEGDV